MRHSPTHSKCSHVQDQELVWQRFGGVGKAPRKTGVHTLFG